MHCPTCNSENPAAAKCCVECGAAFKSLCPKCGSESPIGSKFCAQCGTSIQAVSKAQDATASAPPTVNEPRSFEAHETPEGERKTVTALFADIKGSTELMEDLDPEEARAIIDPALKLMIDAVHRYAGYVVQSTDDGIFALFGAPVAHEDHPQRALYAALRLQEEKLERYSARLREAGNLPIEGRVGVNKGGGGGAFDHDRRRTVSLVQS
jgi:hypothetical protein